MKRKSSYDLWILSTIILSFIGLLLALFFALRQPSPQSSAYFTDLPSAIGLRIRSQVRYAGVPVGTILAIETLDWSERQLPNLAVRVRFSLNRKIPQLKTDSFASIASDTPSSEKFLNISPGSPNADPLPQDAPIPPEPYPTHSSPSSQLPQLPQEFSELISSIRQDYPLLKDRFLSILAEAEATITQVRSLANAASIPLTDSNLLIEKSLSLLSRSESLLNKTDTLILNLENLPAQFSSLSSSLSNSSIALHQLLLSAQSSAKQHSPQLRSALDNLSSSLRDLRITSAYLRILTEHLARNPSRHFWNPAKPIPLPPPEQILSPTNSTPHPQKPRPQ